MSNLLATGRAAPAAEETLAAVDRLLERRLERLAHEWHAHADVADAVLGTDDVPELLARLVRGGKRFRPLLCHGGWVAGRGHARGLDPTPLAELGAALELLHAFALAQDDVMDRSATRRGHPSLHTLARARHEAVGGRDDAGRYGDSVAVLAGDLGHAEADALVAGLPAPVRHLWWRTSIELVRGQARDLSGAATGGGADPLAHALEVARAKSGAYTVQRPLELGATLARATPDALAALSAYGRALGEAFALRDDLLGVWGDPTVTGKPAADDLRAGKATALLALATTRLTGPGATALQRLLTPAAPDRRTDEVEEDVAVAMEEMVTAGVRAEVEAMVEDRVRTAVAALGTDVLAEEGVEELTGVAGRVAWRQR